MVSAVQSSEGSSPPAHVAIIMDGNGRWAKSRGLPRIFGHRRGAEVARQVLRRADELGVSYLTLYSFSSENWRRPPPEVEDLMGLLRVYLRSEVADLHRTGVRVRMIGDRTRMPGDIIDLVEHAEELTAANTGITMVLALSYGSRDELAKAVRQIAREAADGGIRPDEIDEDTIAQRLYTRDIPDPDLVIRTGREKRLSNFLLWQAAYAELIFTDVLWPDFTARDLEDAIGEFHKRERRFGATSA
ncbi:undecaprenyl diphosphate synthase [Constrictibacter sp. MBR-5]|uniref:isoprenyl transferase n=1 Tax=Constrictibacter sp. MBR-5 TaxID=3156467 RepID=UPI003399A2A2